MKLLDKRLESIPLPERMYFYCDNCFSNYHTNLQEFDFVFESENTVLKYFGDEYEIVSIKVKNILKD